jgi:hypothetical protein
MSDNVRDHSQGESESDESGSSSGWTKGQLVDVAGISPKTFDTIRKAARIKGPSHGRLKHVFDEQDMFALIQKVESGRFSVAGPTIALAWRTLLTEAGVTMPEVISRARRGDRTTPPKPLPGTPWR